MKKKNLSILTESAVMIALAVVLSFVKLLDLPYGGSITVGSMFPMVVLSYRHGFKAGAVTGLAYSIIQLLCGLNNLSYATSFLAGVAIVMLDYIVAFSVTSLASFGRKFENQTVGLIFGAVIVGVLRYICHTISGCTVWAGVSIPDSDGLIYSLSYNATYMIPEIIILVAILWYVSSIVDLRSENLRPVKREKSTTAQIITMAIGWCVLLCTIVFDTVKIFSVLQNGETGEFDFSLISNADFTSIGIVTIIGVILCVAMMIISAKVLNKSAKTLEK